MDDREEFRRQVKLKGEQAIINVQKTVKKVLEESKPKKGEEENTR